jgi:hypothetical protein
MSNADRLRSRHGLPMSDILVDIGLAEQHAPSTASQPNLTHPCQWIRSDTIRYTQQGAAFRVLKIVHPTSIAPPTLKSKRLPTSILRTDKSNQRLQNPPLPGGGAPHDAPPSVRTFTSAVDTLQTKAWSCAANTRNPQLLHLETILRTILPPHHTTNPTRSICPRPLTFSPLTHRCSAGSPGACTYCGPLQPMDPPRGTSARPVPRCTSTTPSRAEPAQCYGLVP